MAHIHAYAWTAYDTRTTAAAAAAAATELLLQAAANIATQRGYDMPSSQLNPRRQWQQTHKWLTPPCSSTADLQALVPAAGAGVAQHDLADRGQQWQHTARQQVQTAPCASHDLAATAAAAAAAAAKGGSPVTGTSIMSSSSSSRDKACQQELLHSSG